MSKTSDGKIVLKRGTFRWYEAMALAEATSFRLWRLYLYSDRSEDALIQFKKYLAGFQLVFEERGVSKEHFEYLGWISKQYRLLADFVDLAIRNGYKLPAQNTTSLSSASIPFASGFSAINQIQGVNPGNVVQHPGFYYLTAALYAAERRRAFASQQIQAVRSGRKEDPVEAAAVQSNEKEVDHAAIAVELLTKSYEHFKKHRHGRMTLYLASEIAQEYYEAGKYEMALKFFDRIAKNYRKESWFLILGNILRKSLECTKKLGMTEKSVEYLIELLSAKVEMTEGERASAQQELVDLLNTSNDTVKKVILDMDQINSFLKCEALFQHSHTFLNTSVAFQVHICANNETPVMPIEISELFIEFSDPLLCHSVRSKVNEQRAMAEVIDARDAEWDGQVWVAYGDLMVTQGSQALIEGKVTPTNSVQIVSVSAYLRTASWQVQLRFPIVEPRPARWLMLEESKYGN